MFSKKGNISACGQQGNRSSGIWVRRWPPQESRESVDDHVHVDEDVDVAADVDVKVGPGAGASVVVDNVSMHMYMYMFL